MPHTHTPFFHPSCQHPHLGATVFASLVQLVEGSIVHSAVLSITSSRIVVFACLCTRTPYSLNAISHDSAVGMIKAVLAQGVNVEEVGVYVVVWAKSVCVQQQQQHPVNRLVVQPLP